MDKFLKTGKLGASPPPIKRAATVKNRSVSNISGKKPAVKKSVVKKQESDSDGVI